MPSTKKSVEQFYFDRFRDMYAPFPAGKIVATEEPDFLVSGESKVVGIELTELHREARPGSTPLQAIEAMKHRVIARAQQIYSDSGHPPIQCSVFMNEQHIRKEQVEKIAVAIANIAIRNLPLQNESNREEYNWTNRDYFPEVIHEIAVHRLEELTETHFNGPGATWVAPISAADIKRALASKEEKYSAYRKQCDEAWLLINTDLGAMSTWFEFDGEISSEKYCTNFDRVFILRHFTKELHELNIKRG